MQTTFTNQRVTINLDGTEYPADVDVIVVIDRRRKAWSARGRMADQPDGPNVLGQGPISPEVAILMTKISNELSITSEYGTGSAILVLADNQGDVDFMGLGTPPWPLPGGHIDPR
jgi:hypothetical protein